MGATMFVQPLDLVKNRMQLAGAGGASKEHATSIHALRAVIKNEGERTRRACAHTRRRVRSVQWSVCRSTATSDIHNNSTRSVHVDAGKSQQVSDAPSLLLHVFAGRILHHRRLLSKRYWA